MRTLCACFDVMMSAGRHPARAETPGALLEEHLWRNTCASLTPLPTGSIRHTLAICTETFSTKVERGFAWLEVKRAQIAAALHGATEARLAACQ